MTGTSAVAGWLLTYLVHSTLLLSAVALATRWLVRREALRETLWKTALVGGVLTTTLAAAAPGAGLWRVELAALGQGAESALGATDPAGAWIGNDAPGASHIDVDADVDAAVEDGLAVETDADEDVDAAVELADLGGGGTGTGSVGGSGAWPGLVPVLLGAWALIAALLLGRLAYRHVRLRWLLRERVPVGPDEGAAVVLAELRRSAGVWRSVRLTSTARISSPLALGAREVCVPDRFLSDLAWAEQRAALAHELAHLARRDPAWQLAGSVVGALFFFQPLNRLARDGIRSAAEYLADAWAVSHTGSQMALARCLAAVAGWVTPAGEPDLAGTVAMAEGGSPLIRRVQRLLDRDTEAPARPAARAAIAVGLLAAATGFAPAIGPAGGAPSATPSGSDPAVVAPGAAAPVEVVARADAAGLAPADTLEVMRFDRPGAEGDGFVARLNEAGRDARQSPYWVAYAVPAVEGADDLVIDSDGWHTDEFRNRGLALRLGVSDQIRVEHRIMLARLVPEGGATRVDRLTVRQPQLGMELRGTVYWLGVADPAASLRWLSDIYRDVRSDRVRKTAVSAIAVHDTPEAEPFLRRVLDQAREPDLREEALEGLVEQQAPDPGMARTLFRLAMSDPDGNVRSEAAELLGRIGTTEAPSLLERLAREAPDEEVRRQAAEALGEDGSAESVRALRRLVEEHPSEEVQREALDQLADSEQGISGGALLRMALTADEPDLRREAVELMERLPSAEAVPLLRRAVFESGDGEVEQEATETLGDLGTEAALAVLIEILGRNPSEDASEQAVEAVAENFPPRLAIPVLRRVLSEHPSRDVREEARDYLTELGGGTDPGT